VHQIGRGLSKDGKELVYLELQMYSARKNPRIRFRSRPSEYHPGNSWRLACTLPLRRSWLNSIPVILDAAAGLRTARDLPIGFFSPNARP